MNSIDVSLSIVNWNTKSLTSQLIESIYKTVKTIRIEIFVVDNASADGSVEYIKNQYPEVILIKNSQNVGYGRAHNQALRLSKGRYKMVLNSDVVFLENALENLVDFLDKNREAGAVGPICLNMDGTIGYSYGYFPKPGLMIINRLLGSLTPKYIDGSRLEGKPQLKVNETMEVDNIKGACMLVRKEVCDDIGLFDEDFFAYFEESDWCFRMMKKGIKRYVISNAKIIHISDSSFGQIPAKANIYFENSKILYLRKHYGKTIANIFKYANVWATIRHNIKINLSDMIAGNRKR